MIIYMLRSLDNKNRYYQEVTDRWVEQNEADVWTYKLSPANIKQRLKDPSEIVSFTLTEIK